MSQHEEEKDDYMSESILEQCTAISPDVRSTLLFKSVDKRNQQLQKKRDHANEINKQKFKPARVQEEETRAAGLEKQIGCENKGFQLLSKMGYKPGPSAHEPIKLDVKTDRRGLGQKTEDHEKLEVVKNYKREHDKLIDPEQFRQRRATVALKKATERDVRMAQSTCMNLDLVQGKDTPLLPWYWPTQEQEVSLQEGTVGIKSDTRQLVAIDDEQPGKQEEDTQPEVEEILEKITRYLRSEYLYCIWCGTSFSSKDELTLSCPGNARDIH